MIKIFLLQIIAYLNKKSRFFFVFAGFILVACIGLVRYLTGPEFALSLFFLLPISMGTWFAGRLVGILLSFASASTWLAVDLILNPPYSQPFIPFVNETFRDRKSVV
jgi:hypothetical protein